MMKKTQRKRYQTVSRSHYNEFEKAIDSFIPAAEHEARLKVVNIGRLQEVRPGIDGKVYNHCFFTQFFHKAMNRKAYEAGLRSWK